MSVVPNYNGVLVIINNIPKIYRSKNLKHFFSSFVESLGFICFHYIHREVQKPFNSSDPNVKSLCVSNCCVAKVVADRVHELIETYNGQNWLNESGETLPTCCIIKKIKLLNNGYAGPRRNCKRIPADQVEFSIGQLDSFPEMHPPFYMPNGNVGTTTDYLLNEIRTCRLPRRVVRKLDMPFPSSQSKVFYSSNISKEERQKLRTERRNYKLKPKPYLRLSFNNRYLPSKFSYQEDEEILHSKEGEWNQYETLHDVDRKKGLFEDNMGLNWKNGGSDSIFYPNVQHWNTQEGYFNTQISNDWYPDFQFYKEPVKRDCMKKKLRKICKNDTEAKVDKRLEFAGFEKYNKGIGSKILETLGWKKGQGIGKNGDGIAEPLANEGQKPSNKKGFGYQVIKSDHHPPKEKCENKHSDEPKDSNPPESALASSSGVKLKYQKEFLKETT